MMMFKNIPLLKLSILIALSFTTFVNMSAQQELSTIAKQFESYSSSNPQEKLFIHLDRSTYLAGETIWFKIYCVNASDHKPMNMSKVVYIEVLDNRNKPVLQTKVKIENGYGNGSLSLTPSQSSGNFSVRAYTNWMKNYDPAYYFQVPVTIINSFKNLGLTPVKDSADYDIQFFPEGGNLVENLTGKVAFQGIKNGRGFDFVGYILNQKNDTIVKFSPTQFGIGHFLFTPLSGNVYKTLIRDGKRKIQASIPKVFAEGYALSINEIDTTKISVTIQSSSKSNEPVYLFAHTRQVSKISFSGFLQNGKMVIELNKGQLGEGISHFTLFNASKQPVCERLYFKKPSRSLAIACETDKIEYKPKEKVNVRISIPTNAPNANVANLSLAVYHLDSLVPTPSLEIASYLFLGSDLKGRIESSDFYLNHYSAQSIDNLMLTHGWSRYKWEDIIKNIVSTPKYVPEFRDPILQVKVVDSISNNVVENVETYLSSPGKIVKLYNGKTNGQGFVYFETKELYGSRELILQTYTESGRKYSMEVLSQFSGQFGSFQLPYFDLSEQLASKVLKRSIGMQAQNIYKPLQINPYLNKIDSTPFFFAGDENYNLDDYTRFKTMWEVIQEYVNPLLIKKKKGKVHFSVMDGRNKNVSIDDPLVLLDGVPIFNLDSLMNINPLKLKYINLVSQKYFLGPLVYNGVVNFGSYEGDMALFPIDKNWTVLDYEGIQLNKEFYAPKYESQEQIEKRLPDFRNLLHWIPTIITNDSLAKEISFYTSELQGKFIVVVQGLSSDGNAGSITKTFEVKK